MAQRYEETDAAKMPWDLDEDENPKTQFIDIFPKTILSENKSPDLGFKWSVNPYNGCEHGCTYCYARNSHEYWGYSAGIDFEQKILVKKETPQLLHAALQRKSWQPEFVLMSGNTDCYQPAERTFGLTRKCLEVFLQHEHPVGIITKNALILRDLDLLQELNNKNLLRVTLSITSLKEETRRKLEPRTSSVSQRLRALETLVNAGIAVNVNMAPIIMGINSDEIFEMVKTVGELGAYSVQYIMVRLNGQVSDIFEHWVRQAYPDRAEKILNQIKETHGGSLNETRWDTRMKGQGRYAENIRDIFEMARKKYIVAPHPEPLDYSRFKHLSGDQLSLF